MLSIVTFLISNYFSNEKFKLLQDNCNAVANIVIADNNSSNFKRNAYNIISVLNNISGIDMFICDNSGRIIVCGCSNYLTEMPCYHTKSVISKHTLASFGEGDYFKMGNLDGVYNSEHYSFGLQIKEADNSLHGYVFASTTTDSLRKLMLRIFRIYIISAIIPLIMMFIAVYTFSYTSTRPLKLMSEAAKNMADGDFSKRIPVLSDDEIGELSVSFNNMTNSLSRLESMRRSFVGNVSHELRTPITTISGFIDGIIDGTIQKEKQEDYLKKISDEVKRLSRVIESMLSLSKLESGEVPINITKFNISNALVDIVLSREKQIEEKNIEICGLDTLPKAEISADYDLIYQAIYNLIDNAVKFTEQNGKIQFAVFYGNGNVELIVRNTGVGIESDKIDYIFERFYKLDKSRSANKNSAGLGLYIVKTIIDIHKGKITADSVPNEHTTFKVVLPIENNREG